MLHIPSGRALLDPYKILEKTFLCSDMHYVDFGAGNLGHFVFPGAHIVGEKGMVYAVDILKDALNSIEHQARFEETHNIIPVWADLEREGSIDIPVKSIDLISLVHLSHVLKYHPKLIEEAKRLLKDPGQFLVIDWKKPLQGLEFHMKESLNEEEISQLFQTFGFQELYRFQAGSYHFGLLFQK
jgi:ubiquinone/menaquinone biosynthesis C-methylase UbiE